MPLSKKVAILFKSRIRWLGKVGMIKSRGCIRPRYIICLASTHHSVKGSNPQRLGILNPASQKKLLFDIGIWLVGNI